MQTKHLSLESKVFLRWRDGEEGLPALWFIHGFGASGASFLEAFDAPDIARHRLYVPDLPGYGRSPEGPAPGDIPETVGLMTSLIDECTGAAPIVLVGHSAGGMIGTILARKQDRVRGFVNVEGNLTDADNFISGKVAAAKDVEKWRRYFLEAIRRTAADDEAMRRYGEDIAMAAPTTLASWAVSVLEETGTTRAGEGFERLACPKLYAYGRKSIPERSLAFLEEHGIPSVEFAESGHSPMIDEADRFYAEVARFLPATESGGR